MHNILINTFLRNVYLNCSRTCEDGKFECGLHRDVVSSTKADFESRSGIGRAWEQPESNWTYVTKIYNEFVIKSMRRYFLTGWLWSYVILSLSLFAIRSTAPSTEPTKLITNWTWLREEAVICCWKKLWHLVQESASSSQITRTDNRR